MKQYIKTTEQPFIIEVLDERFDNISIMLTDNALVYGSSLTSIISGLPANGDLDIAVSHTEFMTLCKRFANSSKWKQIAGDKIIETDFSSKKAFKRPSFRHTSKQSTGGRAYANPYTTKSNKPFKYKPSKYEPSVRGSYRNISRTVTFETAGNKHVQIIQAKEKTYDPLADALSVIRAVDFVFCGIGIDKHGKMVEVIKSALDDCNNKIIHVANYHANLSDRFKKYTKRGWNLGISIKQAEANYLKRKEEEDKNKPKNKYTEVTFNKHGIIQIEFLAPIFKKLSPDDLQDLVTSSAERMYGVYLSRVSPRKYIEDSSVNGHNITEDRALGICDRVTSIIKNRFGVKKKIKFEPAGDYKGMTELAKEYFDLDELIAGSAEPPLTTKHVKWADYETKEIIDTESVEEDAEVDDSPEEVDDSPEEEVQITKKHKKISSLIYQYKGGGINE